MPVSAPPSVLTLKAARNGCGDMKPMEDRRGAGSAQASRRAQQQQQQQQQLQQHGAKTQLPADDADVLKQQIYRQLKRSGVVASLKVRVFDTHTYT